MYIRLSGLAEPVVNIGDEGAPDPETEMRESLGQVVTVLGSLPDLKDREKKSFFPQKWQTVKWQIVVAGGVISGVAAWTIRRLLDKIAKIRDM